MAKANRYVINATDTEGEPIMEGEYLTAMTDKAAWSEAVKRAFLIVRNKRLQGIVAGSLAELRVTRL